MKFGEYVKSLRLSKNITLRDMSKEIGIISFTYLGEIERNEKIPSEKIVRALAEYFNIEPITLLILSKLIPDELIRLVENDIEGFDKIVRTLKSKPAEEIFNLVQKVRDGEW